jgi:hypothetical protein
MVPGWDRLDGFPGGNVRRIGCVVGALYRTVVTTGWDVAAPAPEAVALLTICPVVISACVIMYTAEQLTD